MKLIVELTDEQARLLLQIFWDCPGCDAGLPEQSLEEKELSNIIMAAVMDALPEPKKGD